VFQKEGLKKEEMHRFAAVSLLVAGAQASQPTAAPFDPVCPVNILITTEAPTAAPSKSPTSAPTWHPTQSPTTGTKPPTVMARESTGAPETGVRAGPVSWGVEDFGPGLCRCDVFGEATQPFLDRNDTYCGNKAGMLAAWEGATHFTCPSCVKAGTSINITCPNSWETCEILLNLYVCPGCSSNGAQTTTGMWPSSLSTDGWVAAGRCTGDWCEEHPSENRHPFVGFHKQILGGDTEMIPETSDTTMYFSLLVKEGKVCSDINDATQCKDAPFCHWNSALMGGNCYQDWCPSLGAGTPPATCAPCAPGAPEGTCTPTAGSNP